MLQFNIDEIEKRTLSGLKDFQRATVERVDYLFRHNQNRVLVADEVGMGKTLIARGAIVKTARLRIEEKDDLFKVIYICSNQNIANQNIRKLDVTGKNAIGSVSDTRLSMQHLKITEQENDPQIKEGFIQLIPLTPETSFRMTTGGGSVQERALMYSLKIHTATYIADTYPDFKKRINGADRKSDGCRIRSSYAVGFTKDAGDNSKVVMRKENIRNAFNSPMRPFVLATTSIGQEGLDFHNYCRVIMHWNLPSNPIDVGRILRTFKIKKNVEVTDNGKIII